MSTQFDGLLASTTNVSERRFRAAEHYIFEEMKRNYDSDVVKGIHQLNSKPKWWEVWRYADGLEDANALGRWALKVRTNGDWDHKPKLREMFGIPQEGGGDLDYFQYPGTDKRVYLDIYSNIHYGYVGKAAGFDDQTLMRGANSDTAGTGTGDPGDDITMKAGMDMWDKYGANMTEEQFHGAVAETVQQMVQAQADGKDIPQIRDMP
ncbi:hypothetical protein G3I13_20930 [Streptomyces sp. SID6673]|nr:hypothetical protein [Streptomyces sp. SID11726]NEB26804.1 hypothetical protein [Streptomyces sp. SID6673]NED66299.1 hypothetical protein [Streptomyces sp. SID10244]